VEIGKLAIKSMGRPLFVIAHLKKSIIEFNAVDNCLSHAIIIPKVK